MSEKFLNFFFGENDFYFFLFRSSTLWEKLMVFAFFPFWSNDIFLELNIANIYWSWKNLNLFLNFSISQVLKYQNFFSHHQTQNKLNQAARWFQRELNKNMLIIYLKSAFFTFDLYQGVKISNVGDFNAFLNQFFSIMALKSPNKHWFFCHFDVQLDNFGEIFCHF